MTETTREAADLRKEITESRENLERLIGALQADLDLLGEIFAKASEILNEPQKGGPRG